MEPDDRPETADGNARVVQRVVIFAEAGGGLVLEPRTLAVEECRAALRQLLEPGTPLRRKVESISASYRAHDGAKEAAERIAGLAA